MMCSSLHGLNAKKREKHTMTLNQRETTTASNTKEQLSESWLHIYTHVFRTMRELYAHQVLSATLIPLSGRSGLHLQISIWFTESTRLQSVEQQHLVPIQVKIHESMRLCVLTGQGLCNMGILKFSKRAIMPICIPAKHDGAWLPQIHGQHQMRDVQGCERGGICAARCRS
eukprot:1812667-Amphidinium_carterae.1